MSNSDILRSQMQLNSPQQSSNHQHHQQLPIAASTYCCRLCANPITADFNNTPIWIRADTNAAQAAIIAQYYGIRVCASADICLCTKCWQTTDNFHQLYTVVQRNEATLHAMSAPPPMVTVFDQLHSHPNAQNPLQEPQPSSYSASLKNGNNQHNDDIKLESEPKHSIEGDGGGGATTTTTASLVECKVEYDDGDAHAFDYMAPSPAPSTSSSASSSSSSTSSTSCSSSRSSSPHGKRHKKPSAAALKREALKRKKAARKSKAAKASAAAAKRAAKRSSKRRNAAADDDNDVKPETSAVASEKRALTQRSPEEIAEQNVRIREYFQMYCDLCDVPFEVLRDAIAHYRREHHMPGYLRCCGKKFFNRTLVLDHIHHHSDPNAFYCILCEKSYISQAALQLHQVSFHESATPKPYTCAVCGLSFVKYFQLTQHQRQKHLVSTQKSFGCDICGKFFYTKWQMSTHIHSVHIASHICDICATTFKSKTQLASHYARLHSGEVRPKVQCSICAAWLANERCLRKHIERHNQSAVACKLCGKVTPNQSALGSHMRYVHAERNFPCTMCDKAFKRAISLKEHLAAHTGVDLYVCTYCPRTFKSNSNMFAHRKKSHPIEWGRDREIRMNS